MPPGDLGGVDEDASFKDLEEKLVEFQTLANSEELHQAARQVLEAAGYEAWRNEVGHMSVRRS